jgi:hypothetical protein
LSLLTLKYGEPLDAASWEIDNNDYKALQVVLNSVDNKDESIAGPRVYCHKEQTVLQLIDTVKLVLGYTATDRIILSGVDLDCVPKSQHRVGSTVFWRSNTVHVTTNVDAQTDDMKVTGDNKLRHLLFNDDTADQKVYILAYIIACTLQVYILIVIDRDAYLRVNCV